jgi:hypothetical protein
MAEGDGDDVGGVGAPAPIIAPDVEATTSAATPDPSLVVTTSAAAPEATEPSAAPPPVADAAPAPAADASETGVPTPTARAKPSGWARLACFAILPLAIVAGALAHPESSYAPNFDQYLAVGGCSLSIIGVMTAVFARFAHRRALEWLAIGVATVPWLGASVFSDVVHRPVTDLDSERARAHLATASDLLQPANFGASSTGVTLGALALALALLAKRPTEEIRAPLSRALLVGAIVPATLLGLAVGASAHMIGFVVLSAVLAMLALDRVARGVDVSQPRSLALGGAASLAAGMAVAAATTGAASHGLWNALEIARHTMEPTVLADLVRVIGSLELGAAAPVLAVAPALALAVAIDTRSFTAGWPKLPRISLALSMIVAVAALWLDGRNALDARRQIAGFLDDGGLSPLAERPTTLDGLPTLRAGSSLYQEGFVLVSAHGEVRHRGVIVAGGVAAIASLAQEGTLPPVLLDAHAPVATTLSIVAQATRAQISEVRFVGRSTSSEDLAVLAWGPRLTRIPRGAAEEMIILFLLVSRTSCVIASSAGERIEMPGCEALHERLEERRMAEPNRREIVLVTSSELLQGDLLRVLDALEDTGFTTRYASAQSELGL